MTLRMKRRLIMLIALAVTLCAAHGAPLSHAQSNKPFSLPFNTPPSPSTWLLSQQFGNTIGAFNYGRYWYAAGQNLHFGLDFWAPCGTPVVAIADGIVDQIDNLSFGLEPHNLTIFHRDLGYTSVYGHLNTKPSLLRGQPVRRGDVVGTVGDPDRTCQSRPHLHLEIRSRDYRIAYNPMLLIEAEWETLASIGYHHFGGFVKDLYRPNRWQSAYDQPDVDFNERPLNSFRLTYPPPARNAPPPLTLPNFNAPPFGEGYATMRRLARPGCCALPFWAPDSSAVYYYDGEEGTLATRYAVSVLTERDPQPIGIAPHRYYSPDGLWEIVQVDGRTRVVNRGTGEWREVATGGAYPQFSPNSTRLLWHRHPDDNIPGGIPPLTEVWVANVDGTGRTLLGTQQGGAVYWLDEGRLLAVEPIGRTQTFKLALWDIATRQKTPLTEVKNLRGVQVAPGGAIILFYAPFQDDPSRSGLYGMLTKAGAQPVLLPFFSSYRWRDSKTILYLRYGANANPILSTNGGQMLIASYDVTTGEGRILTDPAQPFRIANDDWHVSPDGRHVVFWNADDSALWLISLP
ncbi:MAG: hypothetical protein CUN51_07035 [Candidatus Thermofonsia Clade 1 bacterium]|uniref:M23ase beta-sheet core domain-containing protein n=1 Tax=Candidatus Thermofonsia Clade 1 bacterium TaxID=2364210 RepID=A0A2M8NZK9_9CHLR|nr:MAG: hypothetical protein CUN51_07035 [Candidatus Thermofonsia Clade 1 bacterium]